VEGHTAGRLSGLSEVSSAVVGGELVSEAGVLPGTVLIGRDGRVAALLDAQYAVPDVKIIDARGLLVFPGGIDPHAHLNDPGMTESEDFLTGTAGAAAGGFTTVLEMPQSVPLVTTAEILAAKLAEIEAKAVVDFGLWAAVTTENSRDGEALEALAEAGAIALKAFTAESPEFPRVPDSLLAEVMSKSRTLGLPVGVHCETQAIIDHRTQALQREGRNDPHVNPLSRPAEAEIDAVQRVISLAAETGAALYLVHLSHPESILSGIEARRRGVDVILETCVHYLMLTEDRLDEVGAYAMCNPPLRDEQARQALWQLLRVGEIDCVGSDHCAYTEEEKSNPDFWQVPAGISGIQIVFPLLIGEALRRGVALSRVASMTSANAARRFGLYPRKGALLPGSDADLALVRADSPWVVQGLDLFSKAKGTAYEGFRVPAQVVKTIVRGVTVFDAELGEASLTSGHGQFLHPRQPTARPNASELA
jgi:allantoinase